MSLTSYRAAPSRANDANAVTQKAGRMFGPAFWIVYEGYVML